MKMKAEIGVMGGFYKPRNAKTANKVPEAQRETQNLPALSRKQPWRQELGEGERMYINLRQLL